MDILLELNSGKEENKGGIAPSELETFLEELTKFDNIRVRGLMTIAPFWCEKADYQKYFTKTYQFFIDILPKKIHNIYKPVLSMGMSESYREAIAEGADIVRVGRQLFSRPTIDETGKS